MADTPTRLEVSVIVPARNEEASLAACLKSLVSQSGPSHEVIVVDDHSIDRTRAIAAGFPVKVIDAGPLPEGWSGKCNACWSGAKAATGMWLLFTDADTVHQGDSIAQGLGGAERANAAMLSYSPKQEVHSLAERVLMPVIFAELAATFRPKDVSDPNSPAAAANGQYLLIRREAYDAVGGHAAVAKEILEDVELARRVKRAGYRLQFRLSDAVSARMYRSFGQMWEGWTKNLALLFAHPVRLAAKRKLEWVSIIVLAAASGWAIASGRQVLAWTSGAGAVILYASFLRRILRAHFDWLSNVCAFWGLPLFALLLVNSYISHKNGTISWKGRVYAGGR